MINKIGAQTKSVPMHVRARNCVLAARAMCVNSVCLFCVLCVHAGLADMDVT